MSFTRRFTITTRNICRQNQQSTNALLVTRCRALQAYPRTIAHTTDAQKRQEVDLKTEEGWLFVDSVFPVRLGSWDLRYYIGYLREETLLNRLSCLLSDVRTHSFRLLSLEPQTKDGGVFVKFQYNAGDLETALEDILRDIRDQVSKHGGVPSWIGIRIGNVWLVKGRPWREDMNRFASPLLKVAFDGPDVPEESLYELLRPFGRIVDLTPPSPVPAGTLRSATVGFRRISSAVIARHTIHGLNVPSSSTNFTRLRTNFERPIQAHLFRDWIANHPRIFLPVLIFLLGSLTYTIFDPVRVFMVEGKLNDWFDYRQFRIYQWLVDNTVDRFSLASSESEYDVASDSPLEGVWKERQDAKVALNRYLSDVPNTVTFVYGPQGSGKSRMVDAVLKDSHRKALVIDVNELSKASSDSALISSLAKQTGYWPVFSFLNSVNNLIDLASVGLIGQKTGLSSSISDQLRQILEAVGTGLKRVNASHRVAYKRQIERERLEEVQRAEHARKMELIREGKWHDGRLDYVSGNGVMSELGVGVERYGEPDDGAGSRREDKVIEMKEALWQGSLGVPMVNGNGSGNGNGQEMRSEAVTEEEAKRKLRSVEELQAIEGMPIVVIRNFTSKGGGARRAELLEVLAQWAASLAENHIAHVIVVSDNRENSKPLAKALPSKPLNLVPFSDADNASALSLVKQKLQDSGVDVDFTRERTAYVERLGGRASDLESFIHKVRSGETIEEAVEDIIMRGVSELRKNAFGDDAEDAKSLGWSREQAWILIKKLAKQPEIPYHDVLVDFPFKGDETALRRMEHAELIAISTVNGRPSTIRPGKPVDRYVFQRLVGDPVFQATQDIAFNTKVIASSETTVKECETELVTLKEVEAGTSHWWGSRRAVSDRGEHLLRRMRAAEQKVETLEHQNANLKKVLSAGK